MRAAWQDIHDEALRRIQAREWAPGDLIPTETALAIEFGAARATVNRALQALAGAGWLERRRKAGTRVAVAPQRRAHLAIPLIRQEIETGGQAFTHSLIERTIAPMPPHISAALTLATQSDALHLRTLYMADGRAFAYEDRWVNLAAAPALKNAPLTRISPNEWLVQNIAFSHGTLDYSAESADDETAKHLNCDTNTPLMVLERHTFGPQIPVTFMRLSYAPGHHLYLEI